MAENDPRRLRPADLVRALNSTPLDAVTGERAIYRHRVRAGYHIGDGRDIDMLRYAAWLAVNFQTVGGLMIYSLITNPAAAAFQLVKGSGRAILLAVVFGAASGLGGFLLSAVTDLPSGAVIVLVSSLLVALAAAVRRCWAA